MTARPAALVAAAAAAAALLGAAARAQAPDPAALGDWRVRCVADAGPCALVQSVADADRPAIDIEILAWKAAAGGRLLQVRVPLGVWLRAGVDLLIDNAAIGRMSFERCTAAGCFAEVQLDDRLLGLLAAGSSAIFVVRLYEDQERGIGFPIALAGFAAGFDALPAGR